MATTNLGRVRFNMRGDYNAAADPLYSLLDLVSDGGGSFVYINDTPSNEPTSSASHWQQIASVGGQDILDAVTADKNAAIAAKVLAEGYAAQLAAGIASPAGTYANLAALNSGTPNVAKIYITLDDGKWCYHNGSAWVAGGVYIADSNYNSLRNNSQYFLDPSALIYGMGFVNGYGDDQASTKYVRVNEYVRALPGSVIGCDAGYMYNLATYSAPAVESFLSYRTFGTSDYTIPADCYIRFSIQASPAVDLDLTAVSHLKLNIVKKTASEFEDEFYTNITDCGIVEFTPAYINYISGNLVASSATITSQKIKVMKGSTVGVSDGFKFQLAEYTGESGETFSKFRSMGDAQYTVTQDCFIRFAIAYDDDRPVTGTSHSENLILNLKVNSLEVLNIRISKIEPFAYSAERNKLVDFGACSLFGYYRAIETFPAHNAATTSADYFTDLDVIVDGVYVKKTTLGNDSGGLPIYEYTLKPIRALDTLSGAQIKTLPKILVLGGQHGFEKSMPYGMAGLIKDICLHWDTSDLLRYLRFNTELHFIPVLNRHGFDNFQYTNYNGVNLNRNYDNNWIWRDPAVEPTQYAGESAFDQAETAMVRDWMSRNPDALLFIDCHTNGYQKVGSIKDLNWLSLANGQTAYNDRLISICDYHISNVSANLIKDYGLAAQDNDLCGYITRGEGGPTAPSYGLSQGILGLTVEGFNGFPVSVSDIPLHDEKVKRANAEILGNFIIASISNLSKVNADAQYAD